jgi:hypothetical protein
MNPTQGPSEANVERVAKAIADGWHDPIVRWNAAADLPEHKRPPWESEAHIWLPIALAAIAAMGQVDRDAVIEECQQVCLEAAREGDMNLEPGARAWFAARSSAFRHASSMIEALKGQVQDVGEISDGYHTFNELYEHRHALFLAFCRSQVDIAWRAQQHHDGSSFEGWFILGIGDQPGQQITYHLPMRLWDEAAFVKTLHRAPRWDGHTSLDVIERIKSSPSEKLPAPTPPALRDRAEGIVATYLRDVGAGVDDFSSYEVDLVDSIIALVVPTPPASDLERARDYLDSIVGHANPAEHVAGWIAKWRAEAKAEQLAADVAATDH